MWGAVVCKPNNSFFSTTNCNTQRSVEFRQLTRNVSNLAITLLLIHLTLCKFSLLYVKNVKLQKILNFEPLP